MKRAWLLLIAIVLLALTACGSSDSGLEEIEDSEISSPQATPTHPGPNEKPPTLVESDNEVVDLPVYELPEDFPSELLPVMDEASIFDISPPSDDPTAKGIDLHYTTKEDFQTCVDFYTLNLAVFENQTIATQGDSYYTITYEVQPYYFEITITNLGADGCAIRLWMCDQPPIVDADIEAE